MPKYVAVTGLDYRSAKTGEPIRVEAGDEVLDLHRRALEEELRAGNIQQAEVANEDGEPKK